MSNHYKKPIVRPEQAREWLTRYESGEALKVIAHIDHFDIRTVKRQVEEATAERLDKEVRQTVLRAALEKHFSDLVTLAEKLRSMIIAGAPILLDQNALALFSGLKQHLPRSPLWEYLDKYQISIEKSVNSQNLLEKLNIPGLSSQLCGKINDTLFDKSILFNPELCILSGSQKRASSNAPGDITLDHAIEAHKEAEQDFIMGKAKDKMRVDANNLQLRLQRNLKEELTTIILRRVVPGRCRYCPI